MGFNKDRQDSPNLNYDTFFKLPVTSAQCITGTDKCPDNGTLKNYDDDDVPQGYGQIREAFRDLTKDDILKPYISGQDFRSSNIRLDDVGYNLYVSDIRYQRNFTAFQPIEVEFKFKSVVCNDVNGFALVLKNKSVSMGSDGQTLFDLISD